MYQYIYINHKIMESNKEKDTSQSGQIPSKQKTGKVDWDKVPYLKKLGGVWDFSRAGQSFVTSLSKPAPKTDSSTDAESFPNNEEHTQD